MLDETLHKIAHRGARWPIIFWREEYERLRTIILSELPEPLVTLRTALSLNTPNEVALAKALQESMGLLRQAGLFDETTVGCRQSKNDLSTFLRLAQLSEVLKQKRARTGENLSPEEKVEHDKKIFAGYAGTMYSLEFYLTVYKMIRDAKDEATARRVIEDDEIDTGLGGVPGLWIDFYRLDVPEKFIFLLLDDSARWQLSEAYFSFRSFMLDIRCDQNQLWGPYEIERVLFELRIFLHRLMALFEAWGINRLKSYLLTPFGDQPFFSDIKL